MRAKAQWICSLLTLMFLTTAGCASSVKVPVTRPAEINLRGNNKIAIGEIRGDGGQFIADLMTSRLFETGQFEVVDRSNLARIMKEHSLNMSGAIDQKTAAHLGKLVAAAVIVFGNVSTYKYDLSKWPGKRWTDGKGVPHTTYHAKGVSRVTLSVQVVGLTTGTVLAAKTISKNSEQECTKNDAWPADPDGEAIMRAAAYDAVNAFIKMIVPYTEYVEVSFAKSDSNIPELERGINFAKTGQWADALDQFKAAADNNPQHQGAFWNLGLAYEYSAMFGQAEDAFRKADQIKPCEKCIKEIANVKRRAAEHKKLGEQGFIRTTN